MPLTDLQKNALKVLRPFRNELNYVGGGAALNKNWARLSDDLDMFLDHRDRLAERVAPEIDRLRDDGFSVDVTINGDYMVEAILRKYGFETRVQWMDEPETSRRFFPAMDDEDLGFRLHQADAAVNKTLCAARRNSAARDAVDLVSIVSNYAPLGPLIWALAGKDEALTPPQAIRNIKANVFGYSDEEIRTVRMEGEEASRDMVRTVLEPALERASAYCDDTAPDDKLGALFVNSADIPVEADEAMISSGAAIAVEISDFGVTAKFA
jgi:hypothetical protein